MEEKENLAGAHMGLKLPVTIGYKVLEKLLRERMVGETIQVEKQDGGVTKYAEVLDISLVNSLEETFDLTMDVTIKTLTTVFRHKVANILVQVSLDFDPLEQEISVADYRLKVNSESWLMNKSLQVVANTFAHKALKNKMQFHFLPEIEKYLGIINEKLEHQFEIIQGIFLIGHLDKLKILEIQPQVDHLRIWVECTGRTAVDIEQLNL